VLSGVLLEHFAWGSVFLVNLPAMALLVIAGPMLLPRTPGRPGARFDLLGSALSLGAVLPTVYGVKQWAAEGFSPVRLGAIVIGVVLAVLFVQRQRTAAAPMIDPRLLRSRVYLAAIGGNLTCSFALIGNAVFMTAYLQLVLGYSPFVAALWSLAPALAVGAVAPAAPVFAERLGRARAAGTGMAAGVVGFGIIASHDALATILVGAGVLAAGSVVTMTICSDAVLAALDPSEAGAGAALSEAAAELGGALGIAVLGSVATVAYRSDAAEHLPSGMSDGPAGDSLAGAVGLAASLPDRLAGPVVEAARHAFVQGLDAAAIAGAALLAVAAVLAFTGGRREPSAQATPDLRR
jgi:DHA2 family multidrug resistance protein-like MFS transporter